MASQDKSVTLGISLDTAQLKASAESGAAALANLQDQIKGDSAALQQMQKAMKELQSGSVVNIDQFRKLQQAIDAKKESVAAARSQFLALGGTFEKSRGGAKGLGAQLAELQKVVGGMPGPLASVVGLFTRLVEVVKNNPIKTSLVAVGAAMVGLTAKTGQAIVQLTRYAIAQADARRSELLRLEGLTKIRNYYGVAAGSASELQEAIDRTSASSALSRDQIAGLATQLYKAHFRGKNLADALDAAAIKTSTQGSEQASMWIGYAEAINRTGGNVKGFAQNVRNQLGGIAQKQMLSATVQADKLQESYAALTSGIKIEPLSKARAAFNALFSQSTASGRALKQLLSGLVQPLINGITRAYPIARRFFQGMILACQELILLGLDVADMFGVTFSEEVPDSLSDSETALKAGKGAFDLLAGSLWAVFTVAGLVSARLTILAIKSIPGLVRAMIPLLASIWSQVVAWGAWALEILIAAAPVLLTVAALWLLYEVFDQLGKLWKELDLKLLAKYMWQGFIEYIETVKGWWKGIGQWFVDAFKTVFGIHSPSTVFAKLGEDIGLGLQQGIDATAPDVNQSVQSLVEVPPAPAPGTGTGQGASAPAANGGTIIIEAINLSGYQDPAAAASDFVAELSKALRVVGYQLGTAGGATQ